MKLTGISQKAFIDRYSLKDKHGKPVEKKPDQMWRRICKVSRRNRKNQLENVGKESFIMRWRTLSTYQVVVSWQVLVLIRR